MNFGAFRKLTNAMERGELQDLLNCYTQQLQGSEYAVLPDLEQVAAMVVLQYGWSDEDDMKPLTAALASYCGLTPEELEARRISFAMLASLFMDAIEPGVDAFNPDFVFAVENPEVLFDEYSDEPYILKDPNYFLGNWERI